MSGNPRSASSLIAAALWVAACIGGGRGGGEDAPAVPSKLTVTVMGPGSVTSQPAGIDCGVSCELEATPGTEVTLTASAVAGARFTGWSGGGCGAGDVCMIVLHQEMTVEAFFEEIPPAQPWVRGLTASLEKPAGVITDAAGNVVVAGTFSGTLRIGERSLVAELEDAFVAWFSPDGALGWTRGLGGLSNDGARALAVDANGDVLVAGVFGGSVDFGTGPIVTDTDAMFLLKLDGETGETLWVRTMGGPDNESPSAVAVDPWGDVLVAGFFQNRTDLGAGEVEGTGGFLAKYTGYDGAFIWGHADPVLGGKAPAMIAVDAVGDVYVAGTEIVSMGGGFVLARFAGATGAMLWTQTAGGTGWRGLSNVVVDGDGLWAIGGFTGAIDLTDPALTSTPDFSSAFIARYGLDGSLVFARALRAEGSLYLTSAAPTPAGTLVVGGAFEGHVELTPPPAAVGETDVLVAEMEHDGTFIAWETFGGTGCDEATDMTIDGAGNLVILGRYSATVDFLGAEGGPLACPDASAHLFLLRLGPLGGGGS